VTFIEFCACYTDIFAALLNIHRAYFTQALRENPHDPLRHRYGLSVMALYRSAFRLVEGCSKTFQACPPNFRFFRINFASSKMLSVIVCVSRAALSSLNLTTAPNRVSCIYS
jgi:hypothetical protein